MTARRDDEAMPLEEDRVDRREPLPVGEAEEATDPGSPPGEGPRGRVDTLPDGMELAPPEPGSAETRGPHGDLVAIPYEPATNNAGYNRLLNMLSPPATAPAIQSSTTDGELAAQYDAAGVRLARRSPTPLPEPRVLLNCTGDIAPHTPQVPGDAVAGRSAPPPEDPTRRTVTIVRTRSMLPGVLLGAAVTALLLFLFVCVGVAVRERHRAPAAGGPARMTAARAALVPSLRAGGPDIPPPPPESDPSPSTPEPAPPSTGAGAAAGAAIAPALIANESADKTDASRSARLAPPPPSRKIEREL